MTKTEYIERLRRKLSHMPPAYREEILYDYEEHFDVGIDKGKSEDEIAIQLGLPESVAAQYRLEHAMRDSEHRSSYRLLRAMLTGISLGFFNLVFVFGFYLGFLGVLLAFFLSAVAVVVAGITLGFTAVIGDIFPFVHIGFLDLTQPMARVFMAGGSIAIIGVGILLGLAAGMLGSAVFRWTRRYILGTIQIIRKAGEIDE